MSYRGTSLFIALCSIGGARAFSIQCGDYGESSGYCPSSKSYCCPGKSSTGEYYCCSGGEYAGLIILGVILTALVLSCCCCCCCCCCACFRKKSWHRGAVVQTTPALRGGPPMQNPSV